jgi:hypothetical protein
MESRTLDATPRTTTVAQRPFQGVPTNISYLAHLLFSFPLSLPKCTAKTGLKLCPHSESSTSKASIESSQICVAVLTQPDLQLEASRHGHCHANGRRLGLQPPYILSKMRHLCGAETVQSAFELFDA